MHKLNLFVILLSGLVLAACQKHSADTTPAGIKALVAEDLQGISSLDEKTAREFDYANQNAFSKIFGGTDAQTVRRYLDQRIHTYWTEDELNASTMSPTEFPHEGWESLGQIVAEGESAGVAAANISMELWLKGLVNRVTVRLKHGDTVIAMDAPNVGLMLIGPWYLASQETSYGYSIDIPSLHRQSILLHEARHSDCTGGVGESDLEILRQAKDYRETDMKFKKECGHLHKICPATHEFAGLPACDDLPWGAYSIGYVYGKALAPSLSGTDRAVMDIEVIDNYSRLLFDADAMLAGKLGPPDMSSEGLH